MATPKPGTMTFTGASGKTYSVELYLSDVDGALINWDGGAGAGTASPDFWTPPENVILTDYAMVTGTADTEKIRITVNGRPTQHILRYETFLTSLQSRPRLQIGFRQGARIAAIQVAD